MNLTYIRSNIKRLRRFKGITQREMALRLFMDERTYAKMERGVNKSMDVRLLSSIADILNTDIVALLQNPAAIDHKPATENKIPAAGSSGKTGTTPTREIEGHQDLLQEIRSLKEEVQELIAFQKKAMQLLALASV